MRTVAVLSFIVVVGLRLAAAGPQGEACLTKPANLRATFDGKEAYTLAQAEGKAMSADAVLIDLKTTEAPGADGRTSDWMVQFFSATSRKLKIVFLSSRAMNCSTAATDAGMSPVSIGESADTIFDTARLLTIARSVAGTAVTPALKASMNLRRTTPTETAYWAISYVNAQGMPMVNVIIDSKTGLGRVTR